MFPSGVINAFPSREEMRVAQLLCCGRYCNQCETPAEYALRKRDVDMARILEIAIERELSENEKSVVADYWYNSLGLSQIAAKRGVTPAAVKSALDRAMEKLTNAMTYAVLYQQGISECSVEPLIAGRARAVVSARNGINGSCGERLYQLRESRALSLDAVSKAIYIPVHRLRALENNAMPECDELISFSDLYGVTVDYILKGEINDEKQKS